MTEQRILRGAKVIAVELGCSVRTVRRMARDGRLQSFRTGSKSSPIRCEQDEIARLKKKVETR